MPVTSSAAWDEAEASAPPGLLEFNTIELQNDGAVLARWVAETTVDTLFGIEEGAAFNGGEMVLFEAVGFSSAFPEIGANKPPRSCITIDNVDSGAIDMVDSIVENQSDLILVLRQYLSDDLTAPAFDPIEYIMRNLSSAGSSLTGDAELLRIGNRKFLRDTYTVDELPGLAI